MISAIKSKLNNGGNEHTKKRNFRLFISIVTSVLSKLIGIGSTLITIPVTLDYLGPENFGVWMVISGVVGFVSFSDLGLGMGLQNALSKAYGQDDHDSPKYYISNAYFISFCLVTVMGGALYMLSTVLPIESLFIIENEQHLTEAVTALTYCIFAFLFGIPISLIQRVLSGRQKMYVANYILLVGSLISLFSIFVSIHFDLGLVGLAVLFVLSPITANLLYSLYFFVISPLLRPSPSHLSRTRLKPIISAGMWTVFAQVIYTIKINFPIVIISASLGSLVVAEYSIAQKLTALAAALIGMALQPLWAVYGEAYHRGDRVWVEKTLKYSLKIVLMLSLIAAIAFQFIGQWLITIWIGDELLPSLTLITCFSVWMIAASINVSYTMLLNGTGHFKSQSVYTSVLVFVSLVLSYFLAPKYGSIGVVFTMFFVSELICIFFHRREAVKVITSIDGITAESNKKFK